MGGNNIKGLKLMETIYPSENGQSVIPAEKLQKEIAKGKIQPDDPNAEKELDGDMDERLDKSIREVWTYYDPKGTGIMKKDAIKKFFKDGLEIYALRKGAKSSKDIIAPGVDSGAAMEKAISQMTQTGQVTFKEFEDFLNCYELEEALGPWLNIREVKVDTNKVQFVDTSQFKNQSAQPKKVVYRDYSALQD